MSGRDRTAEQEAAKQVLAENNRRIANVLAMRPRDIKPLTESDFRMVGRQANVPPAVLHVIADKESGADGGFAKDGRLIIADEPQWFSKLTARAYDATRPDISYPKWIPTGQNKKLPAGWVKVWGNKHPMQLEHRQRWELWCMQATENFDAAVSCISMGRFQVMGFHWERFGFPSPEAMVEFAFDSEANHLKLCLKWFEVEDKLDALRRKDWLALAAYNGTGELAKYAKGCADLYEKRCTIYKT